MKKKDKSIEAVVSASFKGTTDIAPELKQAIKKEAIQPEKSSKEVIEFYCNLLNGNVSKLKQAIGFLHGTSIRISSLDPKDILKAIREREVTTQNRRDYIDFINDAIRSRGSRSPGHINEPFSEKKHLTNNKSTGPNYDRYKAIMEKNKNTRR